MITKFLRGYSLTYAGVLTMVIGVVLDTAGTPVVDGDVETTVTTLVKLAGAIAALYGRYRAGGVNALGLRRSAE